MAVANEIIMLENSLFSVISPKGCANILWKDSGRYLEAAEMLKMIADDIYELGLADIIIKEPEGGAQNGVNLMSSRIKDTLIELLKKYRFISNSKLQKMKFNKYCNNIGIYLH